MTSSPLPNAVSTFPTNLDHTRSVFMASFSQSKYTPMTLVFRTVFFTKRCMILSSLSSSGILSTCVCTLFRKAPKHFRFPDKYNKDRTYRERMRTKRWIRERERELKNTVRMFEDIFVDDLPFVAIQT